MARTLVTAQAVTGAVSCVLAAALVVSALSLDATQARIFLLGAVALVALTVCLVIPVETLPSVALVAVILVPDRIANYSMSPVLTPATVVLSIWAVRKLLARSAARPVVAPWAGPTRLRQWLTASAVLLAVVMVPLVVVSPSKRISVAWAFTFVVAVVLPLVIGDFDEEARRLRALLPPLGAVAALYAAVQGLVKHNVIYTPIYDRLGLAPLQHWAVYRSEGSLGHPLTAGLFFAVVLAFCVGRWLECRRNSFLVMGLLCGLGIVSTVSRGTYVSAALAVAAVLVTALSVQARHRGRVLVVLVLFGVAALAALNSNAFVERRLSDEGLESFNARTALPEITMDTSRAYHWLGGGPAVSLDLAAPFNYQNLPIESSYFQLLIGVGAPGLLLFVMVLVLAGAVAVRLGNLSSVGALVAYAAAITSYAALDSRRSLVILLGMLVMIALYRPEGEGSTTSTRTAARSTTDRRRPARQKEAVNA